MAWSVTNVDVRTVRYVSGETNEILYKDNSKVTSFYDDIVCIEFSSDYNQNRDWANREFRIYSYCGPWYECTNPVATSRQDLIDKLNALLASNSTIAIAKNGTTVGAEPTINFIEGSNITLTVTDNALTDSIDVTINSSGGGGGTVTAVTGTSPIASSGGTTPDISIQQASATQAGYLSSTDWTTFNSKGNGTVTSVTATGLLTSSGGTTPDISSSVAKSRLVGRNSVTAGIMEEITVGGGLTLSGTTLSATTQVVGYEMNFLLMGG